MTKEELAKAIVWMMDKGYATGHGDSVVDLLQELEWQVAEREREACAKVLCKNMERNGAWITKEEPVDKMNAWMYEWNGRNKLYDHGSTVCRGGESSLCKVNTTLHRTTKA
jgi:hypothetical protein